MKIIFLNCWFGEEGKALPEYIKVNSKITDIFCLMEVDPKLFKRLSEILPNHIGIYKSYQKPGITGYIPGQAVFVKDGFKVSSFGKVTLHKPRLGDRGFMLYAELEFNGNKLFIANIHAKARPGNKLDTKTRLEQSKRIVDFFENKNLPGIIGGDFNLMPQTKSIRMFEEAGYNNLIREYEIKDTRGKLSHRQFAPKDIQYFADYVFTSPEIKVKSFKVPDVEISDHLPLILDFDIQT